MCSKASSIEAIKNGEDSKIDETNFNRLFYQLIESNQNDHNQDDNNHHQHQHHNTHRIHHLHHQNLNSKTRNPILLNRNRNRHRELVLMRENARMNRIQSHQYYRSSMNDSTMDSIQSSRPSSSSTSNQSPSMISRLSSPFSSSSSNALQRMFRKYQSHKQRRHRHTYYSDLIEPKLISTNRNLTKLVLSSRNRARGSRVLASLIDDAQTIKIQPKIIYQLNRVGVRN